MAKFKDRTGEMNYNNYGSKMIIIKYKNKRNIIVEFENGYVVTAQYTQFKKGTIKNPYDRTVYRVGYLGVGNHNVMCDKKHSHKYKVWHSMLQRCYDEKFHERYPTYRGCKVAEEWHNFQVFGDWYDENYYKIDKETTNLDKDIIIKGNKLYSPETCVFVPQSINKLFTKTNKLRGHLPIGVSKHGDKYRARIDDEHLGLFNTSEEAFIAYKQCKELIIKDLANEHLGKIPMKLYYAMIAYDVEIDD
ncbi:HNH endonuclease [Bacillus phage PBC2]|uniref:AP2/ERF domain-containing protein n=1 Tax=Bacillus phage PBC2 TaxID=1675029 RepID=A0A218KC02_9CAUD|nr:HNH endonuclease [Bacillus phage PBC2]AKQ08408.1 hypothetical protein PBC2_093 [Bacillus phage PBC2]